MRLFVKLLGYCVAIAALCWLVPQITVSFHRATEAGSTSEASRGYTLFAVYLVMSAGLAALVAWDVSRAWGGLAGQLFWGGGRVASITPAWWKAERLCKAGQPLEAVEVLRDYLRAHPNHWRVSVRIAEIYDRKLNKPLAAALEYEPLLKQKLPPLVRAEVLLRLSACQLLLHKPEESAMHLRQVIEEFPSTAAAEKAARRLARIDES